MGVGDRLLVQSDDPNTTAMVAELVRLITIRNTDTNDYTVLKIKKANATDIAKTLDAWFNNKEDTPAAPQPTGGRQGGGGFVVVEAAGAVSGAAAVQEAAAGLRLRVHAYRCSDRSQTIDHARADSGTCGNQFAFGSSKLPRLDYH